MAFALPLLGSLVAPSLASAAGLSISPMIASALGGGLATWAATGDPLKGLEGGALGLGAGALGGVFGGGASAATQAGTQAATQGGAQIAMDAPGLVNGLQTAVNAPTDITNAMSGLGAITQSNPSMLAGLLSSKYALPLGLGGAALLANGMQPNAPAMDAPAIPHPGIRPYQQEAALTPPAGYQPGIDPEFSYLSPGYAMGGPVAPMHQMPRQMTRPGIMPQSMPPGQGPIPMMGSPKMFAMGGGVPGMMAAAMSDGSSDSIPAMIDGHQPAKLSSGEMVIPSDAVSHIGNGSTTAGQAQLQAMVNRVRMAKTGNRAMPKRINPTQMLPA